MRWKSIPLAKVGEKRRVKRFLWYPTLDCDGFYRWLEFAVFIETYNEFHNTDSSGYFYINRYWSIVKILGRGTDEDLLLNEPNRN